MEKRIYLAGPITGLSYTEATEWRNEFKRKIEDSSNKRIVCYSPMRNTEYLSKETALEKAYNDKVLSSSKAILAKGYNDAINADVVVVNFLNSSKVSIGTVMEIAWAKHLKIPIVLIIDEDNIHTHPMINESADFLVNNIVDAMYVCETLLLD